jgi:hypothetical protein
MPPGQPPFPGGPGSATLPGTVQKLRDYVLLSGEKLKAYKVVLRSATRQGAQDIYDKTLAEAQILSESALYAEARMGEVLEHMPDKKATSGGGSRPLPKGIDHKASHYAQQLARTRKPSRRR